MSERLHHRRIAHVLSALDGDTLRRLQCWFGGGTAIALRCGEFRESLDIDFLVSDLPSYRTLRQRLADSRDIAPLLQARAEPIALSREIRADQYGIRTVLDVMGVPIKFEIVLEARLTLDTPGRSDCICDVSTLTMTDLAASKLLANSDRWRDDSVFSRDAIDLAMMDLPPRALRPALAKAESAYGDAPLVDMLRALDGLRDRPEHLQRCIGALSIAAPPAVMLQRLRVLRRRLIRLQPPEDRDA